MALRRRQKVDFGRRRRLYASCQKAGIEPTQAGDLTRLRGPGSTGSAACPENYQWLLDHVRSDLWINPISGGTDLVSALSAACRRCR